MLYLKAAWPTTREENDKFISTLVRFKKQFPYELNYRCDNSTRPAHMELIFRSEKEMGYFLLMCGDGIRVLP